MNLSHVSVAGAIIAVVFATLMGALLYWMLRVPRPIPAAVARTRRAVDAVRRILVPVIDADYSYRGVEVACRLGQEQRAEIVLAYVLEVPRTLPLGAPLPEADARAAQVLERGQEIIRLRNLTPIAHIERARNAADGIIRAAKDYDVDVIVMGIRPSVGTAESVLGRTTDTLLRRAPCELVVDKLPG